MTKVADKYGKGKSEDTAPKTEEEKGSQEGLETKQVGRVTKEDYKMFWGPLDKGANKPSFCYEKRESDLRNEVGSMEKSLAMGYVREDRRAAFENTLRTKKARLDGLDANTERVHKIVQQQQGRMGGTAKRACQRNQPQYALTHGR